MYNSQKFPKIVNITQLTFRRMLGLKIAITNGLAPHCVELSPDAATDIFFLPISICYQRLQVFGPRKKETAIIFILIPLPTCQGVNGAVQISTHLPCSYALNRLIPCIQNNRSSTDIVIGFCVFTRMA